MQTKCKLFEEKIHRVEFRVSSNSKLDSTISKPHYKVYQKYTPMQDQLGLTTQVNNYKLSRWFNNYAQDDSFCATM